MTRALEADGLVLSWDGGETNVARDISLGVDAGETVCLAASSHAFLNAEGRPVRLSKEQPELFDTLTALAEVETCER